MANRRLKDFPVEVPSENVEFIERMQKDLYRPKKVTAKACGVKSGYRAVGLDGFEQGFSSGAD